MEFPHGQRMNFTQEDAHVHRMLAALRKPDADFSQLPTATREYIASVIEEQQRKLDRYRAHLMIIRQDGDDPAEIAKAALVGTTGGNQPS